MAAPRSCSLSSSRVVALGARRRRAAQRRDADAPRRGSARSTVRSCARSIRRRSRFGAGHLGVDFAAPPGTAGARRGPGRGRRSRARSRAPLHVVVAHAGGSAHVVLVPRDDRGAPRASASRAGEVVGTTGGRAANHDGPVLHFGLRIGRRRTSTRCCCSAPVDLTTVVHLAPDRPTPPATRSPQRAPRPARPGSSTASATARRRGRRVAVQRRRPRSRARPARRSISSRASAGRGVRGDRRRRDRPRRRWPDLDAAHAHCDAHAPPAPTATAVRATA